MTLYTRIAGGRRLRGGVPLLAFGLAASLFGCGNLLQVDNPNNIKGADIKQPVAATYLANGALSAVERGYDYSLLPYSVATDEEDWSGSRDAWRSLDQGDIYDPYNEFSDAAFPRMAQGRWLADEAIRTLDSLKGAGVLEDTTNLARAYLYGAMAYVAIADMYDNFVFSNRDTAGSPIGATSMGTLYDQAVTYTDNGLAIPQIGAELKIQLTAMKARAQFDHGIWNLVGVRPIKAAMLVSASDAGTAATTASAALALMSAAGEPDWKYQFEYGSNVYSTTGYETNIRQENRLSHNLVTPDPDAPTWLDQTVLMDPVDNVKDPVVDAFQKAFKGDRYFPLTFLSAREMHLILAEAALSQNGGVSNAAFQSEINIVRGMASGLTDWTPGSGVTALAILEHERRVNLLLQGRRLSDMFRFRTTADKWQPGSQAIDTPGVFLPITTVECQSNPNIGAEKCLGLTG